MGDRGILNCGAAPSSWVRFAFQCPLRWGDLEATDDPLRRLCGECGELVHRVHDVVEAGVRADQGECIAVPAWLVAAAQAKVPHEGQLTIGRTRPPSEWLRDAMAAGPPDEGTP